ncbi:hypothetical protein F5Y12DRAFT_309956 [Xylaria sp. FL1777]|nr:hypothetical protein F5Y12DRAFT_309956 [Xylaria sp. FL1777]
MSIPFLLGHMDDIPAVGGTTPNLTGREIEESSNIGLSIEGSLSNTRQPGDSGSQRPRQRGRYSYLKCSFCRKDKQKCTPTPRQPGQKCNRCLQKGFACSESKTTNAARFGSESIPRGSPCKPSMTSEDVLFQDCLLLLSWGRMLFSVESVANRIHAGMQRRSMDDARVLVNIPRAWEKAYYAFESLIQSLSNHENITRRKGISLALQARIRAQPFHQFDRFLHPLCKIAAEEDSIVTEASYNLDTIEHLVNIIYNPGWESPEYTIRENTNLLAERYIRALEALWERISDMNRRRLHALTFLGYSRVPFVHEFWLRRTKNPQSFLHSLSRADTKSTLQRDCLGRTFLHFQLDNPSHLLSMDDPSTLGNDPHLSIDAVDAFGRSALHIACAVNGATSRHIQLRNIRWVLEKNANIRIRDFYELLAIDYAVLDQRRDVLRLFHDVRGLDIDEILSSIKQVIDAEIEGLNAVAYALNKDSRDNRARFGLVDYLELPVIGTILPSL